MGKVSTLLITYENTSSAKLINDVTNINDNSESINEILDRVSVEPPDYLVNRIIKMVQSM
ncbi:MAG: hypothetical protein HY951_17020 [Bacteroidia bacterium]|nr:hypothetical protein [Bacteroidia bacterium]